MSEFLKIHPEYRQYDQIDAGTGFYNPEVDEAFQIFQKERESKNELQDQ